MIDLASIRCFLAKVYEQRNAIYKSCEIGSYFIDRIKYVEMHRFSISPGDFIISCSGTIGQIFQIPREAPQGVINQALLKLTTNEDVVHDRYFHIFFEWDDFQARIIDSTQGGAMKNLVGMDVFKTTPVVLPPLPEQRAIAEALSDVDGLLAALETLIAKKRAIKQAAMQRLLTGKIRLPGFEVDPDRRYTDVAGVQHAYKRTDVGVIPADWDYGRIGDLTTRVGSGITPTGGERVYTTAGRPFLRSQNVGWGVLNLDDLAFITDEIHASFSASEIQEGDVLLNITGASIGRSAVADTRVASGNVNQHVCEIRPDRRRLDPYFLNSFLLSAPGQRQIDSFQAGGNRQGLNYNQIRSLLVPRPLLPEQRAIATVLSDMDAEIAALERRREKTRAIKQGMMQQLLTGRVRLVKPSPAEASA